MKTLVLTEEKWRSMQREDKGRAAETLSLFQKKLIEKFTRGSLYFYQLNELTCLHRPVRYLPNE